MAKSDKDDQTMEIARQSGPERSAPSRRHCRPPRSSATGVAPLRRSGPFVAHRRLLFVADGPDLITAGFSLLPTEDAPHWSVALSEPTPLQFARVRRHFRGPVENPAWVGNRPPVQ